MADLVTHGPVHFGMDAVRFLDCRFWYEHAGGAIPGSENTTDPDALEAELFGTHPGGSQGGDDYDTCGDACDGGGEFGDAGMGALGLGSQAGAMAGGERTILVLYCEFSSERGPRMFRRLRNVDRVLHLRAYPALAYPHMYLLKGGYKAFHRAFPSLAAPQAPGYVPMVHPEFTDALKACTAASNALWAGKGGAKQRSKRRIAAADDDGAGGGGGCAGSSGPWRCC